MKHLITAITQTCARANIRFVQNAFAQNEFARNDEGAVTIDWVVITAVIAGLGMATAYTLSNTLAHPSNELVQYLSSTGIKSTY